MRRVEKKKDTKNGNFAAQCEKYAPSLERMCFGDSGNVAGKLKISVTLWASPMQACINGRSYYSSGVHFLNLLNIVGSLPSIHTDFFFFAAANLAAVQK